MNPFLNESMFDKSIEPTKLANVPGLVLLKHDNGTELAIDAMLVSGVFGGMFCPKLLAIAGLNVCPLELRAWATSKLLAGLIAPNCDGCKNDICAFK